MENDEDIDRVTVEQVGCKQVVEDFTLLRREQDPKSILSNHMITAMFPL